MIELKIAAKETVKLSFGGAPGWPLREFITDAEAMGAVQKIAAERYTLRQEVDRLRAKATELSSAVQRHLETIDEMRAGRTVDRDAMIKIGCDLSDAREEIAKLKGKTISDWEVRQKELFQEIQDLTKQRDDAREARAEAVAAGTPVYLIDKDLADRIRSIVGVMKPEWQPIATAPKDGTKVLVFCVREPKPLIACSEWVPNCGNWAVVGCDKFIRDPSHWMPLPEPPK